MSTTAKKLNILEVGKLGEAARDEWCASLGLPTTATLAECRAIRAAKGLPPSKLEIQFDDAAGQLHPRWKKLAARYSPPSGVAVAPSSKTGAEILAEWRASVGDVKAALAKARASVTAAPGIANDVGRLAVLRAEISSTNAGPKIKGQMVAEAIKLAQKIEADTTAERAAVRSQMNAASPEERSEIFQRNKTLLTGKP